MGCGAATGAEARERWGAEAVPRVGHDDGEVAAAELDWGGVERGGGVQRGVEWGQEVAGVPRVAVDSRRWPAALLSGGWCRSALAAEEAERERGGRRELDYFAISEKFKGPNVKKITHKLGLK